jgi:hypothetical protein
MEKEGFEGEAIHNPDFTKSTEQGYNRLQFHDM